MTHLPDQFLEDRALRDAARRVLLADLERAKESLNGKAIAGRITSRVGDGAKDVAEVARANVDSNRSVIALIIGAIVLWLAREPIFAFLGFSTQDGDQERKQDGETTDEAGSADATPEAEPHEFVIPEEAPDKSGETHD